MKNYRIIMVRGTEEITVEVEDRSLETQRRVLEESEANHIKAIEFIGTVQEKKTLEDKFSYKYYDTRVIAEKVGLTPAQLRKVLRKLGYSKSPGTNKYSLNSKQIEELKNKIK